MLHQDWRRRGTAIAAVAAAVTLAGSGVATAATSLVGDEDNFGYGGTAAPPCVFFDNASGGDIINGQKVFDSVGVNHTMTWTHVVGPGVTSAGQLQVREYFSDGGNVSTITIDGVTQSFAPNSFALCNTPVVRTFTVPAAALADGSVTVTMAENGDDIALDWSKLTYVSDATPPSSVTYADPGSSQGVVSKSSPRDSPVLRGTAADNTGVTGVRVTLRSTGDRAPFSATFDASCPSCGPSATSVSWSLNVANLVPFPPAGTYDTTITAHDAAGNVRQVRGPQIVVK